MYPTTVPSWLAWYRRLRPAELPHPEDLGIMRARAPSRLAVYTSVYHGDKHLPYLRLEDMLGHDRPLPTPPHEWLKRLNIDQDFWRANISPDLTKDSVQHNQHLDKLMMTGRTSAMAHGAPYAGWALGAVLLALLLMAVRAAEKFLAKKFFHSTTRRQSEEWHTPNVTATSVQHQMPNWDESEFSSPSHHNSDLPPPYTACAPHSDSSRHKIHNKLNTEDPPPPYSACVVVFSNKDVPTVHIQRQHTLEDTQTSFEVDNDQNNLIETRQRMEVEQTNYDEEALRVELVFDNGRVVERTIDVESAERVTEVVAHLGEAVICKSLEDSIPYVDENVIDTNNSERVTFA